MELSKYLREYARTIAGKEQLIINAVAKALEVIPRQLCDNAGFDSINILNRLREKHAKGLQCYTPCFNILVPFDLNEAYCSIHLQRSWKHVVWCGHHQGDHRRQL